LATFGKSFFAYFWVVEVGEMSKYATLSVKVPTEVKEKMKRLGIKPSKVLRKAIEDEIRRREVERIKEDAKALRGLLDKIPIKEAVKSIREDRDNR